MKLTQISSLFCALAVSMSGASALADNHDGEHRDEQHQDPHSVHHADWPKGARMRQEDWGRGDHVDYRSRHLKAPPRGYEWRSVDGNYVLAAVATGVIASIVVASENR